MTIPVARRNFLQSLIYPLLRPISPVEKAFPRRCFRKSGG
jgi:hypothetical protein